MNNEVINCADDSEYRIYCNICDKHCIERYYKKSFEIKNSY